MSAPSITAGRVLSNRLNSVRVRVKRLLPFAQDFVVHVLGQVRISRQVYPAIMHAFLFGGVSVQLAGTLINLMQMQLFIPFVEILFPRGMSYLVFETVLDLAGVSILLGVFMAIFRRAVLRPQQLETRAEDYLPLLLLALIPIAGFSLEAARLLSTAPLWSGWSPVGKLLASAFSLLGITPQAAASIHTALFWTHVSLGLLLVASLPFTKFRHLMLIPLNIIFRPRRHIGALEKIENIDNAEILGVGKITEFSPRQLLSFDACVRCGRCEAACPSAASGMPYSPRAFIQALRLSMLNTLVSPNGKDSQEIMGATISEETPWFCTTCGACLVECPAFVNPLEEVVDLRRYQVLTSGKMPRSVGDALRNIERQGNPWGMPAEARLDWAEHLNVRILTPGAHTDILLFLGCAAAFDERNKNATLALVQLLKSANLEFGILGMDELCCGETARRLGHEYLFQTFTEQNLEIFSKIHFNRIVTPCPHCFNTLKNEYPQFGGDYLVQHSSEILSGLDSLARHGYLDGNGKLRRVVIHDSCYLGRYNHIYSQPRQILSQSGVDFLEMARNRESSFCCGGGGGQMWLETDAENRINHRRLAQAMNTGAEVIATACPYCLLMFDDAIRSKGVSNRVQVLDVSEILVQSINGEPE